MSCQTSFMNVKKTSSSVCGQAASRRHLRGKLGRLCLHHQEEQAMGFFSPKNCLYLILLQYWYSQNPPATSNQNLIHLILYNARAKDVLGSSASRPTQVTIPLLSLQKVSALMKLAFCLTSENRDWRVLAG